MTATNPAGFLQNAGATHTAAQLRTYMGALLAGQFVAGGTGTRTRPGVHPSLGGQLQVTANGTPNMSVNVAAGVAFVAGSESTFQGMYFCHNDGTVNLTIATAPGTGLNRIDLIVAQVQDQFYSGSTNAWSLAVVTGTAAASPSAPAAPNNSTRLAQVFVGANVTSITSGNITDLRQYVSGIGGFTRAPSSALPALPVQGDMVYETDTGRPRVYNGTSWITWPLFALPVAPLGSGSNGTSGSSSAEFMDTVFGYYQFTAQANHFYEIEFTGGFVQSSSSSVNSSYTINVRDGGASNPTISSTLVGTMTTSGTGSTVGRASTNLTFPVTSFTAGVHTLGVSMVVAAGGITAFIAGTRYLYVKDLGPL